MFIHAKGRLTTLEERAIHMQMTTAGLSFLTSWKRVGQEVRTDVYFAIEPLHVGLAISLPGWKVATHHLWRLGLGDWIREQRIIDLVRVSEFRGHFVWGIYEEGDFSLVYRACVSLCLPLAACTQRDALLCHAMHVGRLLAARCDARDVYRKRGQHNSQQRQLHLHCLLSSPAAPFMLSLVSAMISCGRLSRVSV